MAHIDRPNIDRRALVSTGTFVRITAGLIAALLIVSGCQAPGGSGDRAMTTGRGVASPAPARAPTATQRVSTAPSTVMPVGSEYFPDGQQSQPCDGVAAAPDLQQLSRTVQVTTAVVCEPSTIRYVQGQGFWTGSAVWTASPSQLYELVRSLTRSFVPPVQQTPPISTVCDGMAIQVPGFVLYAAGGARIRPGSPGICHTDPAFRQLLADITATPPTSFRPIHRETSEALARSGCFQATYVFDDPFVDVGQHRTRGAVPSKTDRMVSICRYSQPWSKDPVVTRKAVSPSAVNRLWAEVSAQAPNGCASQQAVSGATGGSWVAVVATPDPPDYEALILPTFIGIVELGGCYRVLNAKYELAGYAARSTLATLSP